MVKVPRRSGAPAVRAPGAPEVVPSAAVATSAARRLAELRTGGPVAGPAHPLHTAATCLTCVDVARRTGRPGHVGSGRASGHRPAGTFPPGPTHVTRCQATLLAPRAPPTTG